MSLDQIATYALLGDRCRAGSCLNAAVPDLFCSSSWSSCLRETQAAEVYSHGFVFRCEAGFQRPEEQQRRSSLEGQGQAAGQRNGGLTA